MVEAELSLNQSQRRPQRGGAPDSSTLLGYEVSEMRVD